MLDYKDIITKHCALGMTGSAIAETLGVSKSGVNDFLRAFKACKDLKYPLPKGITNYGIGESSDAPLGSGLFILLGAGLGYAALKKKED